MDKETGNTEGVLISHKSLYEFRLNVNEGRPMKEGYAIETNKVEMKLPQVQESSL